MKFKGACLTSLPLMGELDKFANGPRSIYQYSSMAPRLSGQNYKLIPKRDLNTKKTTPNIEACPESLVATLEYWYIKLGPLHAL